MDIQKVEKQVFKNNFVEHVFKFDDEAKSDILNGIQYIFFAVLLVTVLNAALGRIMVDADETKGDVELVGEIFVHLVIMFVGLMLIDRMITFIPTYSGSEHKAVNMMTLIFVFIVLQMDSESILGRKMRMLTERLNQMWEGNREGNQNKEKENNKNGNHSANGQASSGGANNVPVVSRHSPVSGLSNVQNITLPQQHMQPHQQAQQMMNPPAQNANLNEGMMGFGMSAPVAANSVGGFSSF